MSKHSLRQWFRYKFDNFMARGGSSIFISMMIIFLGLFLLISLIRAGMIMAMPEAELERGGGILHNAYITFLQMTDPGNMNQDVNSDQTFKIPAIIAGFTGLIMLSMLIAFITTTLDQKISELKKGHSKVIEKGHTLILGWNERVIEILRELIIANESESNPCVVILAEKDKEEMDDYFNVNLSDSLNTRIITRSGSTSSLVNLDTVTAEDAKSVIILATCDQEANETEKMVSDTMVIKTTLALAAALPDQFELGIVSEVFDLRHRDIVEQISPDNISTVDTNEILAKILVQTSRSVGLSLVYGEILSFDGCELYFHNDDWGQITFGELAYRWPDGIPMGLRHGDGSISINPHPEKNVLPDDAVLILAEDDSTIEYLGKPVAIPKEISLVGKRKELAVERELLIGWTPKVPIILEEYADYVKPGSTIDIMLRKPDSSVRAEIDRINKELPDVEISLLDGDPLTIDGLMKIEPFHYDNVIILSQAGEAGNDQQTDSETIVILLLLRRIFDNHPDKVGDTKLITEVLDSENQKLVARTGVQDFIISNRFVSMILAQISEDPDIKRVYDDLFDEDGSEIYLKPAHLYFESLPVDVTYADMVNIAQKREEVCLGVKIFALEHDSENNYGVKLIPEKNKRYTLNKNDCLVVVAEDET